MTGWPGPANFASWRPFSRMARAKVQRPMHNPAGFRL